MISENHFGDFLKIDSLLEANENQNIFQFEDCERSSIGEF